MYTDPHTLYRLAEIHHSDLVANAQTRPSRLRTAAAPRSTGRWTHFAWVRSQARRLTYGRDSANADQALSAVLAGAKS